MWTYRPFVLLGLALLFPGCFLLNGELGVGRGSGSQTDLTEEQDRVSYQDEYRLGDPLRAEQKLDARLVEDNGEGSQPVLQDGRLNRKIAPEQGENTVLLLDRAMTRLAAGDAEAARTLLFSARQGLDRNQLATFSEVVSLLSDARVRKYRGADYERILVPTLQALCDLLVRGPDAYAYALQVDEVQESLIQSDFGAEEGYRPREKYRRVPVGSYLSGIIKESELESDEAGHFFRRAEAFQPGSSLLAEASARAASGRVAPDGEGVLHVLYLGGRGVKMVEGIGEVTETVMLLAKAGVAFLGKSDIALAQDAVPVPVLEQLDGPIEPLRVEIPGRDPFATEMLLDLNAVAAQQIEANMPYVTAQAVIRRALKGAAAEAVGQVSTLAGPAASLAMTALEAADLRCWGTLPTEIQAARITLPEGVHEVNLGNGVIRSLNIQRGRSSYVVVIRPQVSAPGTVLVDAFTAASASVRPD